MTLEPIMSPYLTAPHGFFSHQGGVSTGLYAGLNCGPGSHDDPVAVQGNRARVAAHFGAELLSLYQIHSADVLTVSKPFDAERPKADAMVTSTPGLALGILTADCAPVLFEDANSSIVGAAHAGWKGALAGVLENTIEAMCALGADRDHIRAVIGPCISQASYEVSLEFMETFMDEDAGYARFFAGGAPGKAQFDLPGFALYRLRSAGVSAEWTGHCTYRDEDRFFSYRRTTHRAEPDYGRQIAVIAIQP